MATSISKQMHRILALYRILPRQPADAKTIEELKPIARHIYKEDLTEDALDKAIFRDLIFISQMLASGRLIKRGGKGSMPFNYLLSKEASIEQISTETDRLKALARAEVDDFWVTHYKVLENEPFKDWGLLGVRIRDFKYGFGIEWYINSFHGQRVKRVVFSKGLRISKTKLRYSFLDCQGLAKEWELALAMEKEEFFSDVRRHVDKLNMLRRRVNAYS